MYDKQMSPCIRQTPMQPGITNQGHGLGQGAVPQPRFCWDGDGMEISKMEISGISRLPLSVQESPRSTSLGRDSQCWGRMTMWMVITPKKAGLISRGLEGFQWESQQAGNNLVVAAAEWERIWFCLQCGIPWWILHCKFSRKTRWVLGAETSFLFWLFHFSLFFIFNIGFSHSISHLPCRQI